MKTLKCVILIFVGTLFISCSDNTSEKVKSLINTVDNCLIYKYDTLSKDYVLYNIPDSVFVVKLKQVLLNDCDFETGKMNSSEFRFDVMKNDSILSQVFFDHTLKTSLFLRSNNIEAVSQVDSSFLEYVEGIEQNIMFDKDSFSLSFRRTGILSNKICGFEKRKDSTSYSGLFIRNYYDSINNIKHDLASIVNGLNCYWKIVDRESEIKLSSAFVGYPLEYADVTERYIEAFSNAVEWNDYVKINKRQPYYMLTKSIMLESDVYKPLNDFLKTKGYEIIGFEVEKMGYVDSEILKQLGFDEKLIIPMPYMVWIKIGKTGGGL